MGSRCQVSQDQTGMHGLFVFPEIPSIYLTLSFTAARGVDRHGGLSRKSEPPFSRCPYRNLNQHAYQLSKWLVTQVQLQFNCALKPGDTCYLHLRMIRTGESQMTTRATVFHVPGDSQQ
jgi:hypothetical protein